MTTRSPKRTPLAPAIRSVLDAMRARIRRYLLVEGFGAGVVLVGGAFWASLLADWFFEPPWGVRLVLLVLVAGALVGMVGYRIARRVFVPLRDSSIAMLLERHDPRLNESLLTVVELSARAADPAECDPAMLERTCSQAEAALRDVELRSIFNFAPLRRAVAGAVLAAASVGLFAAIAPEAIAVWARRSVLLGEELWPRRTRLLVEGFEGGVAKVGRGGELEVIAKADMAMPLAPQVVQIRYRSEDGAKGRAAMSREGVADPARDRFQEYSYTFRSVIAPIQFDLHGGDCTLWGLRVQVVDNPSILELALDCQFPAYMDRKDQSLPVIGVMQLPVGTQVTVRGRTNKDLVRVVMDSVLDQSAPSRVFEPAGTGGDRRSFAYPLGRLQGDQTLLFTLVDTDGIRSREPVRLALAAVGDQPPQLALELQGIGSAVTSKARLPVAGSVTDDHGIARVWFDYATEKNGRGTRMIRDAQGNPTELRLDDALELADLKLSPGAKLTVAVKAADRYDLGPEGGRAANQCELPLEGAWSAPDQPSVGARRSSLCKTSRSLGLVIQSNVSTSQQWLLEVVTPEQLRAILEARELVLRQRFEAIIAEVTETRDSLVRLEFGAAGGDAAAKVRGAEPGEPSDTDSAERRLAIATLRTERAIQNARKNAHETLAVAVGFDDVRMQLINNRIDTEELKSRLKAGIADPLRDIVDEMFPELERRLRELEATLGDLEAGRANRDHAKREADAILVAMAQVLGRMIEMEDYNEVVEMLREIIRSQEKLQSDTRKQHKERLRELLEE